MQAANLLVRAKMEQPQYIQVSPSYNLKILEVKQQSSIRRVLKIKKQVDCLGTLGPVEHHGCEFPGFYYYLMYIPERVLQEPLLERPNTPHSKKIKGQRKVYFPQPKEKGSLITEKNILAIAALLPPNPNRKKLQHTLFLPTC